MWEGFVITAFTISPGETRARKDGGAIKKRMWIFWDAGSWIKKQENFKIWIKIWWLFWGDFWFHYLLGIHLVFLMVRYVFFINDFWIHIWTWFLNDPWTKCVTHSFTILWNIYFLQGFQISTVHCEKGRTSMGILNESWLFLLISGGSIPWIYIFLFLYIYIFTHINTYYI